MSFLTNFLSKLNKEKKFICSGVFSQVYVYHDGRVFLCPDCYTSPDAQIGNMNEESFEEIWNSKKAQEIRQNALNGLYPLCLPKGCREETNFNAKLIPQKKIDYSIIQKKYPKMVCLGPDWECNVNCIMCRPNLARLTDDELNGFNEKIEKWYLPMLKDAEELTVSTTSDPFGSRNVRLLLQKASSKYPKLRYNLMTNGILCDKYNCKELGIDGKINKVMFSIHASNRETYEKVVKHGNFEKMCENLRWLSELKEQKKIKELYLGFVVSSKNYTDIPDFCEFARKNNAVALFWMCRDWGGNLENSDEPLEVWKKEHPKFEDLKKILRCITPETEYSHFNPHFLHIRDYDD